MRLSRLFLCLLAAVLVCSAPVFAAEKSYSFDSDELSVVNLIGQITVKGHDQNNFKVVVDTQGRDADGIDIQVREGRRSQVLLEYDGKDFVYPRMRRGHKSRFTFGESDGWFDNLFGRGQVKISGQGGKGAEMYADIMIYVPKDAALNVRLGVGQINAENLEGDIVLDTKSGDIALSGGNGDFLLDTGSGDVVAERVRGELEIDTGSGDVAMMDIDVDGLVVDTGSGDITFSNVIAERIDLDTGSGDIEGENLSADSTIVDTGSGDVEISFNRIGSGRFDFDTGSGHVYLWMPTDASVEITADTGSGGVKVDHPSAKIVRMERNEARVKLGTGSASMVVDTGSGGIRIMAPETR